MDQLISDHVIVAAELLILLAGCGILMLDLLISDARRGKSVLVLALAIGALIGAGAIVIDGMVGSKGVAVYAFGNLWVRDPMGGVLKLVLLLAVAGTFLYVRGILPGCGFLGGGRFYALALFATAGMMVMISGHSLITIYIGVELLAVSLVALLSLSAVERDADAAIASAMTYFVYSALASGFLLCGMSLVYGATGAHELSKISDGLATAAVNGMPSKFFLTIGLVLMAMGAAFKLGVLPSGHWRSKVYASASVAVTLFLAGAPKIAAFAIVFRILVNGLLAQAADWQVMLIVLAVLSIALGSLVSIVQTNLKRMLAYTSISHMGFVLLGMAMGVVEGDSRYIYGAYGAAMFYVVTYVLMSMGAFGMILLLAQSGLESDQLDDFSGLNQRSPLLAGVMLVLMLSMAGVPFFVGFIAKMSILHSVIAGGYFGLAVVVVVLSLLGSIGYLKVVKKMYFDAPKGRLPVVAPLDLRLLVSINGLAVVGFGLFPHLPIAVCAATIARSL